MREQTWIDGRKYFDLKDDARHDRGSREGKKRVVAKALPARLARLNAASAVTIAGARGASAPATKHRQPTQSLMAYLALQRELHQLNHRGEYWNGGDWLECMGRRAMRSTSPSIFQRTCDVDTSSIPNPPTPFAMGLSIETIFARRHFLFEKGRSRGIEQCIGMRKLHKASHERAHDFNRDGHPNIPPPPQSTPLLLTGATLHTVSGPSIPNGDMLIDKGKIAAIGAAGNVNAPPNAQRIDLKGKHIYPASSPPIRPLVWSKSLRCAPRSIRSKPARTT